VVTLQDGVVLSVGAAVGELAGFGGRWGGEHVVHERGHGREDLLYQTQHLNRALTAGGDGRENIITFYNIQSSSL